MNGYLLLSVFRPPVSYYPRLSSSWVCEYKRVGWSIFRIRGEQYKLQRMDGQIMRLDSTGYGRFSIAIPKLRIIECFLLMDMKAIYLCLLLTIVMSIRLLLYVCLLILLIFFSHWMSVSSLPTQRHTKSESIITLDTVLQLLRSCNFLSIFRKHEANPLQHPILQVPGVELA